MPNDSMASGRNTIRRVPIRKARSAALAKAVHAHNLATAMAMSLETHGETAKDVQWAIDRLDFDRGRTSFDRQDRSEARHRLVFALKMMGTPLREEGSRSTYRPTIPA